MIHELDHADAIANDDVIIDVINAMDGATLEEDGAEIIEGGDFNESSVLTYTKVIMSEHPIEIIVDKKDHSNVSSLQKKKHEIITFSNEVRRVIMKNKRGTGLLFYPVTDINSHIINDCH